MARIIRIALDLTLISLRNVGPVVSKAWFSAKDYFTTTSAKPLVANRFITKAECTIDKVNETLTQKVQKMRDSLLPKELEYLEKEIEKLQPHQYVQL
ncbi:unnamed protein product [Leptidea sinapis]|uniref:Uncharacterized protein n=1 Tax=Leptidea sinapis TaxID=189913 RepID=A0A5E4PVX0_9NEOP|nr:unnamed protein product [Leptidea sinapis]